MKQRLGNVFLLGMFIFCILPGCRQKTENEFAGTEKGTEDAAETVEIIEDTGEQQTEEPTETATGMSAEESDLYEQMALFIQEGFRRYGIEGTYQAYFGPTQEEEEKFSCSILLEGEEEMWKEVITYTADAERAWYVFEGEDERIFSKDPNMSAASDELHLEDVIGKERSVKSLLESGAFESLWSWMGQSTEDWIAELQLEEEEPLSDYDSKYYLTEDGIGFITSAWGCYNCLEAKFQVLGMEKF